MRSIITAGATKNSIDDVGSHTVVTISSTPKPPWFLNKHSLVLLLFFLENQAKQLIFNKRLTFWKLLQVEYMLLDS